nr:PAS domain S-box protein [uncultured Roseateles sp.]
MQGRSYFLPRLLAIALAVAVPLLVLHFFFLFDTTRNAERAAYLSLGRQASEAAASVNGTLVRAENLLNFLSQRQELRRTGASACNELLRGLQQLDELYANVGVIGSDGRPSCVTSNAASMPATFADAAWFRLGLQAESTRLSDPVMSRVIDRPVVLLTQPFRDTAGVKLGLLVVSLDLLKFSDRIARAGLPVDGVSMLVNEQNQLLCRSPDLLRWFGKDAGGVVRALADAGNAASGVARGVDDVERAYVALPVGRYGLRTLVGLRADDIQIRQKAQLQRSLLAIATVFLFGIVLAWLMGRRLTRPLQSLVQTSRALAAGAGNARADEALPGEFRPLALEFNRMLDARDQGQAALRESERRYADLLDNVALAAVAIDLQGRISYCNDFMVRLSGYRRDELLGQDWFALLMLPERQAERERVLADIAADRLPRQAEREIRTRSGEQRMLHWSYSMQRAADGSVVGVAAIGEDVTERRQAQLQRREAQRQERRLTAFYTALSRTNQLIVRERSEQRLLSEICQICVDTGNAAVACIYEVEGSMARMAASAGPFDTLLQGVPLDYDMSEPGVQDALAARAWRAHAPMVSDDFQADARDPAMRDRANSQGIRSAAAFPLLRDGVVGGLLVLMSQESDFFDAKLVALAMEMVGDLGYALENMANARAQLATRQTLERREHQLAALVATTMDAIITLDHQQQVIIFNEAAEKMFGVPAASVLGGRIERFVPEDLRRLHRQHVQDFASGVEQSKKTRVRPTLQGLRANGELFPIETTVSKSGEGADLLMTVMIRDMSEQRAAEAARGAQARAEASSRAKTEFLSRMSHELRTPLNAVLGFARLLQDDAQAARDAPLSPRQQQQAQLIFEAGTHLRALIDDVLDVARIESGQMAVQASEFELGELLGGVLHMSEAHARDEGIALHGAPLPAPLLLRADAMRLRQVLLNLVSNGIKYNRPGGSVSLVLEQDADWLHLDVIDDGLGMSPTQQAQLFEPFNRLGRERSEIEGTGIGLALSRQLMLLMGGRLDVHSEPGKGTRVRISLPLRADPAVGLPVVEPVSGGADGAVGLRGTLLYIEDNEVNVLLVQELLSRWPALQFSTAPDGASGLAMAELLQPDLVLLDMQLPDMDGLQLLRHLRARASTRGLRVVALSASAMSEEVAAALAAGALDYWTKPLDFERFVAGLQGLLGES